MDTFNVCRLCLSQNVRMYNILNTDLQGIYESLTHIPLSQDTLYLACYICYSLLKKTESLRKQCVVANNVLSGLLQNYLQTRNVSTLVKIRESNKVIYQLNQTQTEVIEYRETKCEVVQEEPETALDKTQNLTEFPLKQEALDDPVGDIKDLGIDNAPSSDSEDNIPLKDISTMKDIKIKMRKVFKKRKIRERRKSFTEDYATEIVLTKDQQIQSMNERSKSENYLKSPYKCHFCYKGFISVIAYENHRHKHDEKSGPYVCEICRMRYNTERQLRSHAHLAHSRQYVCNKCGLRTHTANQAREHDKWHKGYTYQCQLCSEKFFKPTSYLTHMRKHHATEHVCVECGLGFIGRRGLKMHTIKSHARNHINDDLKQSTDDLKRHCTSCNIQFRTSEAWSRHVLTSARHTLDISNRSSCIVCDLMFTSPTQAQTHMRGHLRSLRPPIVPAVNNGATTLHSCEQCGNQFDSKSKLQMHIKRVHLGLKYNKNIVCEVCGKKCTSNASLRYHQRCHSGERPHACPSCDKQFARAHQLRLHARTHSGERPYTCDACPRAFTQRPALSRHYRVHTGIKPYLCTYCTKTFSQSNSLKLHVRSVHLKLPPNKKGKVAPDKCEDENKFKSGI